MPKPQRFVWYEMAGVVGLLVVLLAPLGFLASEMMEGGRGGGVSAGGAVEPSPMAGGRSGLSAWKARRPSRPSRPLASLGGRESGGRSPAASSTPFSASWRTEATPNLLEGKSRLAQGRRSLSSGGVGEKARPSVSSRTETDRSRGFGSGQSSSGPGAEWRGGAQRLAGRAQALSRQLGQLQRGSDGASANDAATETQRASKSAETSRSQADNPPLPGDEPTVPIDDHLHWLLAAGVLWGAWRLWRGG